MTKHEKLMALHRAWMGISKERDELAAQMHDIQAEIDALNGDAHGSAWHLAAAKSLRTRSDVDRAEEDRLWVVAMSHSHLRNGTVPSAGDFRASEIEQQMDTIRGEQPAA